MIALALVLVLLGLLFVFLVPVPALGWVLLLAGVVVTVVAVVQYGAGRRPPP